MEDDNPYAYYYNLTLMGPNIGTVPPRQPPAGNFENIEHVMVGEEKYTVRFNATPEKNYKRFLSFGEGPIGLLYTDGTRKKLSQKAYVALMNRFAAVHSLEPMEIIEERK